MYKLTEEVFEQLEEKADKKDIKLKIDGGQRKVWGIRGLATDQSGS
jgi:hypothetical protein